MTDSEKLTLIFLNYKSKLEKAQRELNTINSIIGDFTTIRTDIDYLTGEKEKIQEAIAIYLDIIDYTQPTRD